MSKSVQRPRVSLFRSLLLSNWYFNQQNNIIVTYLALTKHDIERLRDKCTKCSVLFTFSTLSSGLNSLAAVVWEDMVRPMSWSVTITEGRQVFLTRAIAAFMGKKYRQILMQHYLFLL